MKNILIISSSPRNDGNSELLARQFEKGASENKYHIDFVKLRELKINYCLGCYACEKLGHCVQKDDMNETFKKMLDADVILFATPTYFYSMSGQLKVFIDRCVQNYTKIHADIYIFITAWDSENKNLISTLEAVRGFTRDCLENCQEKGYILAGGVTKKGEIVKRSEYLKLAYQMGQNS